MTNLFKFLLNLWQLPQIILGYLILIFVYHRTKAVIFKNDITFYFVKGFRGGISLGNNVIMNEAFLTSENSIKHEYGHTIQSKILGLLYLIVIGIPSITWATLYGRVIKPTDNGYYKFYTEKWADKLGKVNRK